MRKQFTLLALLILILPILFLTNSFNKEQKNTYLSRAELNDDQSPPMPANIITPTLYCLGACPTIALSVEPTEVMPTISSSPSQPPTVPSDTPTDDPCGTAPSSKENKNSVKATSDKGCTDQGGKCQS